MVINECVWQKNCTKRISMAVTLISEGSANGNRMLHLFGLNRLTKSPKTAWNTQEAAGEVKGAGEGPNGRYKKHHQKLIREYISPGISRELVDNVGYTAALILRPCQLRSHASPRDFGWKALTIVHNLFGFSVERYYFEILNNEKLYK